MASLSVIARRLNFIRETEGPNRGAWVEMLQRFCGGKPGDSWCADFVSFVVNVAFHGASVMHRTGSCQEMLDSVRGRIVSTPQVDDLYFFVGEDGRPHHVGIVTSVQPLVGIAGNTSEDGISTNGTGVFEHSLRVESRIIFARLI